MSINRRDFLKLSTISAGTLLSASPLNRVYAQNSFTEEVLACQEWSNGSPPIFCTAYIDPTLTAQKGQEGAVAKYPLALIPQDSRLEFMLWRDRVRKLNPKIKLLAYQMLIEETTVPGPGHDIVRSVADKEVWATYPGGFVPTVKWENHIYRMHDPRNKVWQDAFLAACEKTLKSYSFDGLFLDNCTIYPLATLIPSVRDEMLSALNIVLVELRNRFPDMLIIGNSSYHFQPLNGSLNENRPSDLALEGAQRDIHSPIWNLHQMIYNNGMPAESTLKSSFEWAIKNRCFFGASIPDYQHAIWPPLFEQIVQAFKNSSPTAPLIKGIS